LDKGDGTYRRLYDRIVIKKRKWTYNSKKLLSEN
jgi:hypothetical protein